MSRWAEQTLSGWGGVHRSASRVARPEKTREIEVLLAESADLSVIARGAGRSYGDTALNTGGDVVLTTRLDRFLRFDTDSAQLIVEPGVLVGDLVDTFSRIGFMPRVVPGTGCATVGGAIANDVHGKNHHLVGSFGESVEWVDLRVPSGDLMRISNDTNSRLFKATIGGLGLTGIIERACLSLQKVPSNAVLASTYRIRDLDHFLASFEEHHTKSQYVFGWIDALARRRSLGRGILEVGNAAPDDAPEQSGFSVNVPFFLPSMSLNSVTVRMFNAFYRGIVGWPVTDKPVPYTRFLFPLDTVRNLNRIYGRRGFRQFQCVVPFEDGRSALRQMLECISSKGGGSFLAVLKALGRQGIGYMSFTRPGFTLALDFPNSKANLELIHRLEKIALDFGGRVYLAKDSTLPAESLPLMYPQLDAFREQLMAIDPERKMRSDLSDRLRIRE